MKLREIMKPSPLTVTEITRLGEAHQLMTGHRIRHLPLLVAAMLIAAVGVGIGVALLMF